MREGNAERGFTLIELMIVVAIIAVLAAVVIPMWTKDVQKGKGSSEVNAMFAELATKEDQYKNEIGSYLAASACPTSPVPAGGNFATSCITSGSAWESLRVQPPSSKMYCSYTIVVGASGSTLTPPTGFKNSQGTVNTAEPSLASSWWYLLAECDEDGQGGTNSQFYESSVDQKIQKLNEGK